MNRIRSYLPLVVMFAAGIAFAALGLSCRALSPFNFFPTVVPTPTLRATVALLPSPTSAPNTNTPPATTESIPTPPEVPLPTRTPVIIIPIYSPSPIPTAIPPTPTSTPRATNTPIPTATPQNFPDWRGEYYNNPVLGGEPVLVRNDRDINFDWSSGAPDSRLPADSYSVRWTRSQNFGAGTYRFTVRFDDGARLFVDGSQIVDEWRDGGSRTATHDINLNAGTHALRLEYYERTGLARAQLEIALAPANPPTNTPLPAPSITPLPFPSNTPQPAATGTPVRTQTPVPPTITPLPLFTQTPVPTQPAPPTVTSIPSPIPATATIAFTPIPINTDTPTPQPSATKTSVPPTQTHTPVPTAAKTAIPIETDTPQPTVQPTRRPTVTILPGFPRANATLSNGNQLLVTGTGWTKNEQVNISVADNAEGTNARRVTRAKASDKGVLKVNLTLKEAPPKPLYIVVSGTSGTLTVPAEVVVLVTATPTGTPDPNATATPIP